MFFDSGVVLQVQVFVCVCVCVENFKFLSKSLNV